MRCKADHPTHQDDRLIRIARMAFQTRVDQWAWSKRSPDQSFRLHTGDVLRSRAGLYKVAYVRLDVDASAAI